MKMLWVDLASNELPVWLGGRLHAEKLRNPGPSIFNVDVSGSPDYAGRETIDALRLEHAERLLPKDGFDIRHIAPTAAYQLSASGSYQGNVHRTDTAGKRPAYKSRKTEELNP